jgi:APA family basic amino acid/polyamine antiporter
MNRTLSVLDASMVVLGSMLGGGVFLVAGVVARDVESAGAFLVVWLVGGFIALAGALANGELGALFPRGGGEYVYLREAYGPLVGFLSGWTSFCIGVPGSIATLARGFARAAMSLWDRTEGETLVALAVVGLLTGINALGLAFSKWTQNVLSTGTVLALLVLIALGLFAPLARSGPSHFTPLFSGQDGVDDLLRALLPVFFAYSGWNAATYIAGEIRNPQKNLGRALVIGTTINIALYLAVNLAYLRALPLSEMRTVDNVAAASVARFGAPWTWVITPLFILAILSSLQATVLTGPRIVHAMAEDGLFFRPLGRSHSRTHVPVNAIVVQGLVAGAFVVSGTFERLLAFTTFWIVMFSTLTVAAVMVLRWRRPDAHRPFRTSGYPFVPAAFVLANIAVMVAVLAHGLKEVLIGLLLLAFGVVAYATFRARARA